MSWKDALNWLDAQRDAMIDMLQRWSNINSGTLNLSGLARMREELTKCFNPLKATCDEIEIDPYRPVDDHGEEQEIELGTALRWTHRLDSPRSVFMCIHMDTVYGADHPFQNCRWSDDGKLNGPGVADAKGGLLVLLFALRAFEQTGAADRIGWEVFVNPDEEIGSPGSTGYFAQCAPRHDFGLLFEPTLPDGTMVDRRRGSGNYSFVVHGQAAHAGREFERGRNAIARMCRLGTALHDLNSQRPDITVNLGRTVGGGALNMVPDVAILHVNVRVDDSSAADWLDERFRDIAVSVESEDGFSCRLIGSMTSPPKFPDDATRRLQHRIEECGRLLGQAIEWTSTGGTCDGNKLFAYGLPNIDTLGVRGGKIHSDEEFVLVDSLVERAKLAALMLTQFAEHQTIDCSYT